MTEDIIKVLIVDDESLARDYISELLQNFEGFRVIGECANGNQAVKFIRQNSPDLVFLDVQMPEMDGLTVLERIKDDPQVPEIIFVTAYDQYAIKAFDFQAIDYLLKPFSEPRFEKAVMYAKERILQPSEVSRQQFSSLLEKHKNKSASLKRIFVKDKGKTILIDPETIDWFEAEDKYVYVHAAGKSYLIRQTLNALEFELDCNLFRRIHRSAIVNLTRVQEFYPSFNGDHILILTGGTKLTLSRSYKDNFFDSFGKIA